MTFRGRVWVMGSLIAAALTIYGVAKLKAPSLMTYVTEQTLLQKAPPGTDTELLDKRFHAYLSSLPDSEAKLQAIMAISQYLEKIQQLSPQELDRLLKAD
jgi:hypothetical protein